MSRLIEDRLKGSLRLDAHNGDQFERGVFAAQVGEAIKEIEFLRAGLQRCVLGKPPGDCYAAEVAELRAQVSALQQKVHLTAAYDRIEAENAKFSVEVTNLKAEVRALEAENARLRALDIGAMPATTDYANGWNDCRQASYEARHAALKGGQQG